MGDANYFGTRDHYMFITYKDMIKLTYPVLLHDLIKDYYDDLKDFLELQFQFLSLKLLLFVCWLDF